MIAQGLISGCPASERVSALPMPPWLGRLCRTLFWALWMLSPLPAELAQPALHLLADLAGRAHHIVSH